jgi:hypothetical protein
MPISVIPFRRSALYMNKLVAIANAQAATQMIVDAEKYKYNFETTRAEDLARVYSYIERGARGGAVRIFNWDSTPKEVRELIFNDDGMKGYLTSNGFNYSDNAIEWYAATELK